MVTCAPGSTNDIPPRVAVDIDQYRDQVRINTGSEAPYGDADAKSLEVFLSTTSARPTLPSVARSTDLAATLGGTQAYAGFAGATGGAYMEIKLLA